MREISFDEFWVMPDNIAESWAHMELQDRYAVDTASEPFRRWQRGEPDDLGYLDGWCAEVRALADRGCRLRRIKVVRTPLNDYHRWIAGTLAPIIDAGEQHRWAPRERMASVPFPVTDFYLLDDREVAFLFFDAEGAATRYAATTDPAIVDLCRTSFARAWQLSVPHDEFHAALVR
ncbi:hypothetical protein GCM10010123_00840 [Pilimelia anulata]|uniref:DUF6879 domain-containing protein n=1 Tax=Pilimelia anulata TaxID=53371 RepID=A0A8J3AZ00_9ACTN|nr:DUF6879 family protein [Pilimelia anulata]GGJ74723.1 hypothetical protein GCM10010123_00840 [Pilimelia anulata]